MTTAEKPRYYYVAHEQHWSYVTGLEAAYHRLAEYLGTTFDDVRTNRRRLSGLIKIVSRAEARAAGIEGRREPSGYTAEQVTDALAKVIDPTPRDENGNALGQFAVTFRVSNTSHWQVFGLFPTLAEAREARKQAIASGFRAPATATTQGKVLCWNIEPRD